MGSPSNASAAFLPGLHHHYMSAKAKQAQQQQQQAQLGLGMGGIGRALRGASGPLFAPQAGAGATQMGGGGGGGGGGTGHSIAGNYMGTLGLPASASSTGFHTHTHGNVQTTYRTTPSPFDLTQTMHHGTSAAAAAAAQTQAQQQQVYGLAGQYQLHQAQQQQAAGRRTGRTRASRRGHTRWRAQPKRAGAAGARAWAEPPAGPRGGVLAHPRAPAAHAPRAVAPCGGCGRRIRIGRGMGRAGRSGAAECAGWAGKRKRPGGHVLEAVVTRRLRRAEGRRLLSARVRVERRRRPV